MSNIEAHISFPHPEMATADGLLAIGGNLAIHNLLTAYSWGIFPWYDADEPIMWWSLDPRLVLFVEDLKVSKSMRSYFNQNKFQVSYNTCFQRVMESCQVVKRKGQDATWIHKDIVAAYVALHEAGHAHSVEVWSGDELVGGLYGVAIGRVFFGESMFALQSNASKFGFISLVRALREKGFWLIDCQQDTAHLRSMGADTIDRGEFLSYLRGNMLSGGLDEPLRFL